MSLLQRVFIFAGVLTIAFHQAAFAQEETPTPSPTWNPMNTPAPKPRVTVRPGATLVLVPGGTIVAVSLTEPISSASASVNDEIGVVVKKEVDAGGFGVVPAGAQGEATITTVDRAGGNGHGGQLAMSVDWVFSSDGGRIPLSTTNHASENGDQKGAASTATIATYLLLGPLGLFAHNFVRGKDVTIETDKVFTVFVDHDVHVQATQKAAGANGSGFDQ